MRIELVIASISGVVAIGGASVAYLAQTGVERSRSDIARLQLSAQQAHDRQKPFIEAQMKYYIEAAETTAKIPRTADKTARNKLVKRFWELYWGPLALVEDQRVAVAMIAYSRQLNDDPTADGALQNLSLDVAHACRDSLKQLWVQELGEVNANRPAAK